MPLREYRRKRDFKVTPEPAPRRAPARRDELRFVIQKHDASHLHYDFRLELGGVLKSWAVPKGPSLDPADKRLAVQVEDHPLDYGSFEGTIPKGQYGGGTVLLWDHGTWAPQRGFEPASALRAGKLKFTLRGHKLHGGWTLIRMHGRAASEGKPNWLLVKEADKDARPGFDVLAKHPLSVKTGRDLPAIANNKRSRVWQSNGSPGKPPKPSATPTPTPPATAIAGARRASLPTALHPQLARLVDAVPADEGWFHELKFDGYRILAFSSRGNIRLITRNGKDWSDRFPQTREALQRLRLPDGILDGELVALNDRGVSDFQALQNALKEGRTGSLVYFVFDVPYWDGSDLTASPLHDRHALLHSILKHKSDAHIRLSEHIQGSGPQVLRHACRHHLEGIVSKRADSTYDQSRSGAWVKTKCGNRQEFVIGGFTDPRKSRVGFGSLLLGYYNASGDFTYAGRCGAGFDEPELNRVLRRLKPLQIRTCPYTPAPTGPDVRHAHWTKPKMVAEIAFTQWTRDGRLRHPVYQGEREDKPASDVVRESPRPRPRSEPRIARAATPARTTSKPPTKPPAIPARHSSPNPTAKSPARIAGVTITHPDREIFPGITKADLAAYYEKIAPLMMPHIADRAVSIVRCPSGGPCFFQKHLDYRDLPGLTSVPIAESKGTQPYLVVKSPIGLISLVQMNCLELHSWGAPAIDPDHADRLVIDLDPGDGVPWSLLVKTANLIRTALSKTNLRSFVKTTGGKGLHIVAPLNPPVPWETLKPFARALAEQLAAADPAHLTSVMSKAQRPGRIFIDYLRNGRGATSVAPYSTRARPGATISAPLRWEDLPRIKPATFTIHSAPSLLKRPDPWKAFPSTRQSLPKRPSPADRSG